MVQSKKFYFEIKKEKQDPSWTLLIYLELTHKYKVIFAWLLKKEAM